MTRPSCSLLLGSLLLAAWGCHPAPERRDLDSLAGLEVVTPRDRLYDVAFAHEHAWVVGFPGLILHSPDGGETWESQAGGGGEALFDVELLDDRTGWIAGRNGLVLHTSDGGETWRRQETPTTRSLYAIDFQDGQEGWAVGEFATVLHTMDGGQRWVLVPVTLAAPAPPAAAEPEGDDEEDGGEEEDGFGDAPGGDDYGVTGGSADEELDLAGKGGDQVFDKHLNGVEAQGPGQVLAAGEAGVILRSDDGGRSWRSLDSGEWATLYGIGHVGAPGGPLVVAGSSGVLRRSLDAGSTWTRVETGTEEHLFRASASGGRLFVVGRRGLLLAGPLDGEAVAAVPVGVWGWISSIAFGPDGQGLLVGGQGLILRTTDHGASWRRPDGR
ncbi:MAG: hypothetical protein FJ098_01485 [Deltaproteobacteria bacterium]|nr:hypothetical protein [Deltaproteobacteria bacterium]